MTPEQRLPGSIILVGPMLGRYPGRIASPAEPIAERLRAEGVETFLTSSRRHPVVRAAEIYRDISRLGGRVEIAVVLTYSGRSFLYADLASRAARQAGIPVVFWIHGGGLPAMAASKPGRVERVLARGAAAIVPSDFLRRASMLTNCETIVIPNLVDTERFTYRPRRVVAPRLLWMRAFVPHCRPDLAIRTLAELVKTQSSAELTMAGSDQGELGPTRRLAHRLGVSDRVRFVGFVDGEEKLAELDRHDIFLHTNEIDNAPISLLEAAACGLPVVGRAVGGVADLLQPDRECLLTGNGTAEELAAQVSRVLADPEATRRRAEAAREVAESSSWNRLRELWLSTLARYAKPTTATESAQS